MSIWRTTVRLTFNRGSGHGTNTWHWRDPGTNVAAAAVVASEALEAFYGGLLSAVGSGTTIAMDGVFTTVDDETPAAMEIPGARWSSDGTGSGSYMDTQSCVVVGWRTSLPTRHGRGRTFIGPLVLSLIETSNGTIAPPALANFEALADDLIEFNEDSANGAFVVWSPSLNEGRDIIGRKVRDTFAHLSSRRGKA